MIVSVVRAMRSRLAAPFCVLTHPAVGSHGTVVELLSRRSGRFSCLQRQRRVVLILAFLFLTMSLHAQSLQVNYGAKAVQTISFGGVTLEDVGANPGDAFHIWHMRATDMQGNLVSSTAGARATNGTYWDAGTQTETYFFSWGMIQTQFLQQGNNLNLVVTETNNPGSGIIFDGAEIYPFFLHFPQEPKNFNGYSQYSITTTGPGVTVADFGSGVVTSVLPDEAVPMYGGWKNAGPNTYSPMMATTAPDGLATFLPSINRPVQPGTSFSYTVSLRFTAEGRQSTLRTRMRASPVLIPAN